MNKLKLIIKKTLLTLKKNNIDATPDNYFKEFIRQSQLENLNIDESKMLKNLLENFRSNIYWEKEISQFSHLSEQLINRPAEYDLKRFIVNLEDILSPSIKNTIQEDIERLTKKLIKDPNKLVARKTITKIKDLTEQRISDDKSVLKDKTDDMIKLTNLMGKYFNKTLLESGNSIHEVEKIKNELEELNISESSKRELSNLHAKLIDTVYKLENNIEKNKEELQNRQNDFKKLQETVENLQEELNHIKKERDLDFLTNVLNRRAFEEELTKMEKKYQLFGAKYAIIFYDIDHFKSINDTYGHDCGDAVLRTFSGILKKLTRQEDVISRYGGEEFLVLINYEKEKEIINYLKRVKDLIHNSDFNYKYKTVDVRFSAGLAFRDKYENHLDAIKKADELLYEAKSSGRDRIVLDDKTIL